TEDDEVPGLSESASKVLLSSPFPSDAVPVQNDKRFRMFVGLFVAVGATVVGVTIWWLSSGSSNSEVAATPAPTESAAASVPGEPSGSESATVSTAPRRSTGKGNLAVVAEAVRDVWIRTTIDGRTDGGRTLAAGESIDVSAEQSISLRVGDAGAVVVSVNGEKRPLGRDGEVVTRTFVAESAAPVRVPAPQPAPAPAAPSTPARALPPVASSAPVAAPRVPLPTAPLPSAGNVATANPPSPPPTPAPAPAPTPAPSQLTGGSQVGIPNGVVNQLTAPAAPLAAPAAAPTSASPATMVVAVARQWLDAYHRQDRAAMAALSTDNLLLADERRADERFPSGLSDVTRTLDRVSVQIAADTAVLTAVMMEQSTSTASSPHVSPVSQVWVLSGGQWKVRQARFVSEARLNSVFK
ncbi:MAG TPA: RodZ domain-containing protein, partial [Vicinamibacterales bacterium]|nr:RodZ domain-containing protein [Vicinamibacterales bacterium]